ncbi:MAG: EFR1 family ferrodoxin, partial [Muribaculaceae bacterium]|nr:EFR1 family ferrodoxin [Muribaculaceae bacterium]
MIIVFSGTGNTLHIAGLLAAELSTPVIRLRGDMLRQPDLPHVQPGEPVIWAFPIYAWGVPPVILSYLRKLQPSESMCKARHFTVVTYGDDAGNALERWRKSLAAKGLRCPAIYGLQMPNTYVLLPGFDVDDTTVARQKISNAENEIKRIAQSIRQCSGQDLISDYRPGAFPSIKSRILRPLFTHMLMSPKPFRSTPQCTMCGMCARQCPLGNISADRKTRRMQWGNNCALCLGCYHICPHHAVAYGN